MTSSPRPTNFFSQGSPYLVHPLLTPDRTSQEVDFVLAHTKLAPGARILDIGCGPGRHSIELSRRGYRVTGIDPSRAMLVAAQQRAVEAGTHPALVQMKGEQLALATEFDAVVCLFTTLGQIHAGKDNLSLIERSYATLRPLGWLIVEVPNRDWIAGNLKENDRFGSGENYTDVQRRFDPTTDEVTETFRIVSPQQTREYVLRYRVFTPEAVSEMFRQAGFRMIETHEDYQGSSLQPDSPSVLFFARKDSRDL